MRSRYISKDFWSDEDIAELDHFTRLLYIGLWSIADKRGVMEYRPKRIKAILFPYDDLQSDHVVTSVELLCDHGFIALYKDANDKLYIWIRTFAKHQRLTTGEKKNGKVAGPLPTENNCTGVRGQTKVKLLPPYTEYGVLSTEYGVRSTEGDQRPTSAILEFYELFKSAHPECMNIKDFEFANIIREAKAEWGEDVDVLEAIESFARDWCGSAFTGTATPVKEFRKYLRNSVNRKNRKKETRHISHEITPEDVSVIIAKNKKKNKEK